MAGRVLRSSNGRFAGSTKGWGGGRKLRGATKAVGTRIKKINSKITPGQRMVAKAVFNAALAGGTSIVVGKSLGLERSMYLGAASKSAATAAAFGFASQTMANRASKRQMAKPIKKR